MAMALSHWRRCCTGSAGRAFLGPASPAPRVPSRGSGPGGLRPERAALHCQSLRVLQSIHVPYADLEFLQLTERDAFLSLKTSCS